MFKNTLAGLLLLGLAAAPAVGETAKVGACKETRIAGLGPRLEGVPESGSSVAYANGLRQTSYDVAPALQRSRIGDAVRLCLVSRPKGCPKGDDRGSKYAATNLRTSESWTLYDSQHRCGGA